MTRFQFLVISLAFSHLISSCHGVPSTRAERLLKVTTSVVVLSDAVQIMNENKLLEEARSQRMDIEINDYPGSSANDRHTPKPPE